MRAAVAYASQVSRRNDSTALSPGTAALSSRKRAPTSAMPGGTRYSGRGSSRPLPAKNTRSTLSSQDSTRSTRIGRCASRIFAAMSRKSSMVRGESVGGSSLGSYPDARAGRHREGDPGVASHDGALPDHRVATQDGGVGVDRDVVLDGRVALVTLRLVGAAAVPDRERAQGHALIHADAVADVAGLADDDARAVIYEERRADRRARVDVDPRARVRVLGEHARYDLAAEREQAVGDAIDRDRVQT